jgi:hypothetical protein
VYSPAGNSSARPSCATSPAAVRLFSFRKYTSANGQFISTPFPGTTALASAFPTARTYIVTGYDENVPPAMSSMYGIYTFLFDFRKW